MFRKLILASAVSLALLPGTSWSLGLGGIRTQSALNEPFLGEIDLYEVKPDELDSVKVRLAPKEEFEKAGSPWSTALSKLRFQARPAGSGAVIEITSKEPVREPYLDFLIEVIWPQGRMVKGYTVLLDPPVTLKSLSPQVPLSAAAKTTRRAAPPRDRTGYPLRYGPVKPGDSLWKIARTLAPAGATIAQTAMAIYRTNQNAFIRGNIHRLRQGVLLEIPTPEELFALDVRSAQREFSNALAGRRVTASPLTDITQSRLEIAAAPSPETARMPISASGGAAGPGRTAEFDALQRELLLVQESAETNKQEAEELRARVRELESQLNDIRMLLKLRNEQIAQLQSLQSNRSPAPPEPSVVAMHTQEVPLGIGEALPAQGIAAEPPEPAAESSASEEAGEETAPTVPDAAEYPDVAMYPPEVLQPPVEEIQPPAELPELGGETDQEINVLDLGGTSEPTTTVPEQPDAQVFFPPAEETGPLPAETMPQEIAVPQEITVPQETSEPQVTDRLPPVGPVSETAVPDTAVPPKELPGISQKPAVTPSDTFSLSNLSLPLLGAAAGIPIGLGLLGFWWMRRKKVEEEEEFLLSPTPTSTGLDTSEPSPDADTESFDSNLPPSTDSFSLDKDTEEADVLSEVDVYLAFGRYREAENLLKEELQTTPDRLELKFKLAEVYHGSENLKDLMALREELRKAEAETRYPDLWKQLNRWVSELAEQSQPQDEVPPSESEPLDIPSSTPTTSELDTIQQPISETASETSEMTAPFELSALAEGPFTEEPSSLPSGLSEEILPHPSPSSQSKSIGMDLSSVQGELDTSDDLDDIASTFPEEEETITAEDQRDTLRVDGSSVFDSRMDDSESRSPESSVPSTSAEGITPSDSTIQTTENLDPFSEGVGTSESEANDVFSSQWDMDSGLWDETGTKLDLARAYMEMEDTEAAREILEEVIADGNEQQKKEAQEMLKRLEQ